MAACSPGYSPNKVTVEFSDMNNLKNPTYAPIPLMECPEWDSM